MLTPNTGRIIVELLRTGDKQGEIYLPQRENVKAGENLLIGKVIHPGETEPRQFANQEKPVPKFKEGQIVMFQEYSMSGVYKDIKALVDGTVSISETMRPENQYHVVAEADIMASYEE